MSDELTFDERQEVNELDQWAPEELAVKIVILRAQLAESEEKREAVITQGQLWQDKFEEWHGLGVAYKRRAEAAEADAVVLRECVKQVKIMLEREKDRQGMAPATDVVMAIVALRVLLAIPHPGADRLKRMTEALEFYADDNNYRSDTVDIGLGSQEIPNSSDIAYDEGQLARAALTGWKGD